MSNEKNLYQTTKIIWYVFYFIEALLLFRFMLKLLGANPGAGFTSLIYNISAVPLAPFQFVFPANSVASSVFEWSTLLAMVVYYFIAWGIVKLVLMGREVDEYDAEQSLNQQDNA